MLEPIVLLGASVSSPRRRPPASSGPTPAASRRQPPGQLPSRQWVVSAREATRLGTFLGERLHPASGKQIKKALEANACRVNGRVERFPSRELRAGDQVEFRWPGNVAQQAQILYSDADLLVLDKPAGWVCDPSLPKRLEAQWGPLWLVHRLDKETSGALLLARSPEIRRQLEQLFADSRIHKVYWAAVDGCPTSTSGVQQQPLIRKEILHGQQRWGAAHAGEGLPAETRWSLLRAGEQCALLRCEPITGRTHQIRVHLALMGHPILGDRHYAARFRTALAPERVLLHARSLHFPHPRTGLPVDVEASLPEEMTRALEALGLTALDERS
jgi:RluA family pseudouridine synthase